MDTEESSRLCHKVTDEVGKAILDKQEVLEQVMLGILVNGHVLLEDFPGLAKTLMARSFAATLGCKFRRIQFTPDLLPADITGTYIYNQKTGEFDLREGPIFTNIMLADEIGRAPPRTQAALLEAMQERQVTLEGRSMRLADPFVVFATQNPIEYEGIYPLPEAQLDRFQMKLTIGYPSKSGEVRILRSRIERETDDFSISETATAESVVELQKAVERIHVDDDLLNYMVDICQATRRHVRAEVGASPRGSLALLKLSRARALYHGRDYVLPDDVKKIAVPALAHRLILKSESWIRGATASLIVEEVLTKIPVPKVA